MVANSGFEELKIYQFTLARNQRFTNMRAAPSNCVSPPQPRNIFHDKTFKHTNIYTFSLNMLILHYLSTISTLSKVEYFAQNKAVIIPGHRDRMISIFSAD